MSSFKGNTRGFDEGVELMTSEEEEKGVYPKGTRMQGLLVRQYFDMATDEEIQEINDWIDKFHPELRKKELM